MSILSAFRGISNIRLNGWTVKRKKVKRKGDARYNSDQPRGVATTVRMRKTILPSQATMDSYKLNTIKFK